MPRRCPIRVVSYRDDHQAVLLALEVARAEASLERRRRELAESAAEAAQAAAPSPEERPVRCLLQPWIAILIGVVITGTVAGLLHLQLINEMFKEAGWWAWISVITGLAALVLSLRYLVRPDRQRFRLAALATGVVFASGLAGLLFADIGGWCCMCDTEGYLFLTLAWLQEHSNNIFIAGAMVILNIGLLAGARWRLDRINSPRTTPGGWRWGVALLSLAGLGWWALTTPALENATYWNLGVLAAGLGTFALAALHLTGRAGLRPLVVGALAIMVVIALMGMVWDINWSPLGVAFEDDTATRMWWLLKYHLYAANNLRVALPFVAVGLGLLMLIPPEDPQPALGARRIPPPGPPR